VAGYTYEEFNGRGFNAGARNLPTDAFFTNNLSAGEQEQYVIGSGRFKNQLLSYLGRANYSFMNKYLITAAFRIDGSSRFGEENKFGYFPSLALGWRLVDEGFISNMDLFSELKLRASYGVTGNQEIGNYQSQVLMGVTGDAIFNKSRNVGIAPVRLGNPDFKWETTRQVNVGLDYGFLEDRITGSVDYFVKNTNDLLLFLPIPRTSGFSTSLQNVGDVRNSGLEFLVNSHNIVGEFNWSTTFNLATVRNEVTNLGPLNRILQGGIRFIDQFSILEEGAPINAYFGYQVEGVFQSAEEIANSAQPNAQPGQLKYRDTNNDGQINADDRTIIGSPFPDFTVGINNNFSYRGFDFSFFFDGSYGNEMLNFTRIDTENPIEFRRNRQDYVLERWTAENPSSEQPSFRSNPLQVNSRAVEDASFLRLRNLRLGYSFPRLQSRLISSLSMYLTGQNLFTITNYSGFNPDVSVLGTSNLRVDYNAYPLAKIYTIGINIGI
jgi:TonB-linked SusC/RagA family outer membrane protein